MENPRIMIKSDGIQTELFLDGEKVENLETIHFEVSLRNQQSLFYYEKREINEYGRPINKRISKEFSW